MRRGATTSAGRLAPAGLTQTHGAVLALLAALAWAVVRRGAFYPGDAGVLLLGVTVSLAVAVTGGSRLLQPAQRRVVAAVALLLSWWLVSALLWGLPSLALPFAVALFAFGAAYAVGCRCAPVRMQTTNVLLLGGALYALVGLVGLALRSYPLTIRSQDLYRFAGTLSYANASGALLAMLLALAVGARNDDRTNASVVLVLSAALSTTMCRGAVLAVLLTAPLLGFSAWRRQLLPLLLGAAVGVSFIATSAQSARQPLPLVLLVAALVVLHRKLPVPWLVGGGALVLLALCTSGLGVAIDRRLTPVHADDRSPEWAAAWRQFLNHPWRGSGPERHLFLPSGEIARFAHNEPLQLLASAGAVGLLLLLLLVFAVYRATRAISRPARVSLAIFACCACFDFVAHIPALTTMSGLLAATMKEAPE